jgi:hypothetical protein
MSITKILERHQTLMAEASKALDVKAPTADMVQLPLRHQEQRIETLKRRIDGLEQAKRQYRLDESRKVLATAEERPAPRTPKKPPQTPRDGSKKSQRRDKK